MADWAPLFVKFLSKKDSVISSYARSEYNSFANTIPPQILNEPNPSARVEIRARIMFREDVYNGILRYYVTGNRAKFVLHHRGIDSTHLRVHRKIDIFYKWTDSHLHIKLVPAISPIFLPDDNYVPMVFKELTTKKIQKRDLKDSVIRIKNIDVAPFYETCPEDVKEAIRTGTSFSVHIFAPGSFTSEWGDMYFEKGYTRAAEAEYLTGTISLRNYLASGAEEFHVGEDIKIWYRQEENKMELAFTNEAFSDPP
jgi:hypothetical protein